MEDLDMAGNIWIDIREIGW